MVKCLRSNTYLLKAFEILFIFCVFLLFLHRIHYGIDFSDESWYVAEPYAVAELGLVPFVNNVTQSPGFTVPLALAFKLYVWINGSTEGIVLFSRVLYLFVGLWVTFLAGWVANRYTEYKFPLLMLGAMIALNHCHSIFDVTYNTIGIMYVPLIMAMVFADYDDDSRRSFFWGFCAGVLAVRVVMGTLQSVIGLLVVLFYLYADGKRKRVAGILTGCLCTCIALVFIISIIWGAERICAWWQMFCQQAYFAIESRTTELRTRNALISFFSPTAGVVLFAVMMRIESYQREDRFSLSMKALIVGGVLLAIVLSVRAHDHIGARLMMYTWTMPYLYYAFSRQKPVWLKKLLVLFTAYFCTFFFAAFANIYGFSGDRAYWWWLPLLLTIYLLIHDDDGIVLGKISSRTVSRVSFAVCILAVSMYGLYRNYYYVYRDSPIPELSVRVEEGIWRGLFTTDIRARNVFGLEQYIKSVTREEDFVLYLDWVSFGYLMGRGKICSPATLDVGAYSYKVNDPRQYYMYFDAENNVPDKIIYIDYGRDKLLSIDNGEWKFNELVNGCYRFTDEYRNKLFTAKMYVLHDREGALRLVRETLRSAP